MAVSFLNYIPRKSIAVRRVHIVFAKYHPNSTEDASRDKHGKQGHIYHILDNATIPRNWSQFLMTGTNKANLAAYYTDYIAEHVGVTLEDDQTYYTSGGISDIGKRMTVDGISDDDLLTSNQEEADGWIILHAITAANRGAHKIVVESPDTDVLVLLLHHRVAIRSEEIYLLTGRGGKHQLNTRYIPVHAIHDMLTQQQHAILLSAYCLSGCDTTCTFRGHGKKTAFQIMINKASDLQPLALLGTCEDVPQQARNASIQFVGSMYGQQNCTSLNMVCCQMVSDKKVVLAKKLPPTEDSFNINLLCCIHQLILWRNAANGAYPIPDPTKYGFEMEKA
jgi:hypothetical protein